LKEPKSDETFQFLNYKQKRGILSGIGQTGLTTLGESVLLYEKQGGWGKEKKSSLDMNYTSLLHALWLEKGKRGKMLYRKDLPLGGELVYKWALRLSTGFSTQR